MRRKKSRIESPKLPHPEPGSGKAGRCRYCGCTETTPCHLTVQVAWRVYPTLCWWIDEPRTICTARQCLRKARRDGLLPKLRVR
jgi:hypothetical protein